MRATTACFNTGKVPAGIEKLYLDVEYPRRALLLQHGKTLARQPTPCTLVTLDTVSAHAATDQALMFFKEDMLALVAASGGTWMHISDEQGHAI